MDDHDTGVRRPPSVRTAVLTADGPYPNNGELPVLVYEAAVQAEAGRAAETWEALFAEHGWTGAWRNGIFSYHHYHSTAHEVLGIARGQGTVQLGGPHGPHAALSVGDALVLPAGVAHKNLEASRLLVVGAYADGRDWDLKRGAPADRPEVDRHIEQVPCPSADPIYGSSGPLLRHWT